MPAKKQKVSKQKTGASVLIDCLEAHKTKYVFGVPGASLMPILEEMRNGGPEFVVCRHEQNAAFMAQAWGRLTGTPGVCLATVGPGATNLVTGVATATADRDPVVAITGQTPRQHTFQTRHQNINAAALFAPITKWSVEVDDPDAIPEAVAQGFRTAMMPRPGAVHIALPTDVLQAPAVAKAFTRLPEPLGGANTKTLTRAAQILSSAKRPVVLVGVGASDAASTTAVRAFLKRTHIPAVGTFEAAGIIGRQLLNQFLGRVGLASEEPGDEALREADVVVTIGYDLVEYAPSLWLTNAKIIHIDRLPAEVDGHYVPAVELIGDISRALERLGEELGEQYWMMTKEEERIRDVLIKEQKKGSLAESDGQIHPARLVAELRKALQDNDLLVSDVGSHQVWLAREFFAFQPRTLLFSMGFQTMGVALPWAMAARMAEPTRRIVSCSGDGSFLMSVMELETAVRRKLPLVHVVWRDGTYNLVEIQQLASYGRVHGTQFGNPDIVKLAESFGAKGMRVTRASDLAKTLEQAFKIQGPVVIDVPVDYRHNVGLLGKGALFGGRGVD